MIDLFEIQYITSYSENNHNNDEPSRKTVDFPKSKSKTFISETDIIPGLIRKYANLMKIEKQPRLGY